MQSAKVLVVEEEKEQEFEEILPQDEYMVLKATRSKNALTMVMEEKPDLMILDLELPGMNGIEVLRRLQISTFHLPVIAVSSIGTVEAAVEAIKCGACDYLTKPLNTRDLKVSVSKGLQELRGAKGNKHTDTANCLDIQTLIDEVKETMLERGANLEEANRSFEKRLTSIVLEKVNEDDETKIKKRLEINRESSAF